MSEMSAMYMLLHVVVRDTATFVDLCKRQVWEHSGGDGEVRVGGGKPKRQTRTRTTHHSGIHYGTALYVHDAASR